jgi:hypothetical protein
MHKAIHLLVVICGLLLVSCLAPLPFQQGKSPVITPSRSSTLAFSPPTNQPQRFSPATTNGVGPEDILREVSLFVGAGGGGGQFCDFMDSAHAIIDPAVLSRKDVEWFSTVIIPTCGWQPNEFVRMTVRLPDGRIVTQGFRAMDAFSLTSKGEIIFGIEFRYEIGINDPLGLYQFLMEGDTGTLQYSINVIKPKPHVRDMTPKMFIETGYPSTLFLYGFYPNEQVRLFMYADFLRGKDYELVAWQPVIMDSNGQRFVVSEFIVPAGLATYFAVGEVSGQVPNFGKSIQASGKLISPPTVPVPTQTPNSMDQAITRAKNRCDKSWFFTPLAGECILHVRSALAVIQIYRGGLAIEFKDTRQVFVFYNPPGDPKFPGMHKPHSWGAFHGNLSSLFLTNPQLKFQLEEPVGGSREYSACVGIGIGANPWYEQKGYITDADNKVLSFLIERNLRETNWWYTNARATSCSEKPLSR